MKKSRIRRDLSLLTFYLLLIAREDHFAEAFFFICMETEVN